MKEIRSKRTVHSKTFDLGGGRFRLNTSSTKVHYVDEGGELRTIDLTPRQTENGLIVDKCDYQFRAFKGRIGGVYRSKRGQFTILLDAIDGVSITDLDLNTTPTVINPGQIVWENIVDDLDIELVLRPFGVEYLKHVKGAQGPHSLSWSCIESNDASFSAFTRKKAIDAKRKSVKLDRKKTHEKLFSNSRSYVIQEILSKSEVSQVKDKKTRQKAWAKDELTYPITIDADIVEEVTYGADDGYQGITGGGSVNHASASGPFLGLGGAAYSTYSSLYNLGVRFRDVGVPVGATIDTATLVLYKQYAGGGGENRFYGYDVDDAGSWDLDSDLGGLSKTTEYVTDTTSGVGSKDFDVTAIVQEIVDRAGFTASSNIGFMGIGVGGASTFSSDWFCAYENGSNVPTLEIDYRDLSFLSGWNPVNRIKITLNKDHFDATESDFPVMVKLSDSSGLGGADVSCVFDELGSDANRKKIAFTTADGTTALYAEIEFFDYSNYEAWIHVLVPEASSSVDTVIYLYFDSSHADNAYISDSTDAGAHDVWDSDFKAVWHMAQDPDGDVADAIKESTSNAIDLTPGGAMTSADLVNVGVAYGLNFDGSNDYLATDGNVSALNLGNDDFTIEFVVNYPVLPSVGTWKCFLALGNPALEHRSFIIDFYQQTSAYQYIRMHTFSDGTTATQLTSQIYVNTIALASDTDYLVTLKRSGGSIYFYVNGALIGSSATIGTQTLYTNTADPLTVAAWHGTWDFLAGVMSEVRISGSARSASWVKATYYSLWDYMNTFSEIPISGTLDIVNSLLDLISVSGTLDLVNGIQFGSTLELVNSLNVELSSNITLVNNVLQVLDGALTLKLSIEERSKVTDTIVLLNRILDASGASQYNYEFSKGHGL